MPFKNEEAFIGDTLLSVLSQSYRDWEIIAVDDHSTDSSPDIVKKWVLADHRIQYYLNRGRGILDALQTAQSKMSGDWVTRMDGDDLMGPGRFEEQLQLLVDSGPRCIATGKVKYFSDKKLGGGFRRYEEWLNNLCKNRTHFEEIYKECVIPSPSWLMRTEEFRKINGFKNLEYPEDYDFVFRLYQHHFKIVSTDDIVLLWRDHPGRASRNLAQYADQTFFELKWKRFLQLDYSPSHPLILWGAGPKGKKLAGYILRSEVPFSWISGNVKKLGKDIYGVKILSEDSIVEFADPQIIIAISSPEMLSKLRPKMEKFHHTYYFC